MKTIGGVLLSFLLLVYACNIIGSSGDKRKGMEMNTLNNQQLRTAAALPRIDAALREKIETATFALG